MISRLALGIVLAAVFSAQPARAGQIDAAYSISSGFFSINMQSAQVQSGSFYIRYSGGETSTKGTVMPGPASLTRLNVQLTGSVGFPTMGGGSTSFNGFSFMNQWVPGSLRPASYRADGLVVGGSKSVPARRFNGTTKSFNLKVASWFKDNVNLSTPGQLQLFGSFNPTFSLFVTAQEVSRMAVPEPSAAWLVWIGPLAVAVGLARARRPR